jgi:hypothetical protein
VLKKIDTLFVFNQKREKIMRWLWLLLIIIPLILSQSVTQWTIYVDSSGYFGLSPTLGCGSGATATRICNDISSAIAAAAAITPTHVDLDTVDIIMAPGNYNSGCFTISLFDGKLIQYRFSAPAKNLVQWNYIYC